MLYSYVVRGGCRRQSSKVLLIGVFLKHTKIDWGKIQDNKLKWAMSHKFTWQWVLTHFIVKTFCHMNYHKFASFAILLISWEIYFPYNLCFRFMLLCIKDISGNCQFTNAFLFTTTTRFLLCSFFLLCLQKYIAFTIS